MAKVYQAIHQWNHWLTHFLGKSLLEAEQSKLETILRGRFGKSAVLLGVPHQSPLLQSVVAPCPYLLGPLVNRDKQIHYIEGDFHELPIQSGSVDHVILPHTLEYLDNPRQLLSEACRIVKPEGYLYILGFNPYSFWGLRRYLAKHKHIPWSGNFLKANTIKKWLELADFELQQQDMILFRPPFQRPSLYQKFKFLEWIGQKCFRALGGVYILQAKAKVIPLTPIRLHWKQELSGVRISTTTLGPTIRNQS